LKLFADGINQPVRCWLSISESEQIGAMVLITARCYALEPIMPQYVVCPSVRLSVCLSVTFMYRDQHIGLRLEYFDNNVTAD